MKRLREWDTVIVRSKLSTATEKATACTHGDKRL